MHAKQGQPTNCAAALLVPAAAADYYCLSHEGLPTTRGYQITRRDETRLICLTSDSFSSTITSCPVCQSVCLTVHYLLVCLGLCSHHLPPQPLTDPYSWDIPSPGDPLTDDDHDNTSPTRADLSLLDNLLRNNLTRPPPQHITTHQHGSPQTLPLEVAPA